MTTTGLDSVSGQPIHDHIAAVFAKHQLWKQNCGPGDSAANIKLARRLLAAKYNERGRYLAMSVAATSRRSVWLTC